MMARNVFVLAVLVLLLSSHNSRADQPGAFFQTHCVECHDSSTKEAGLDLSTLKLNLSAADNFARWVKIHDRIESGEMPPKKQPRPPVVETAAVTKWLKESLIKAEQAQLAG